MWMNIIVVLTQQASDWITQLTPKLSETAPELWKKHSDIQIGTPVDDQLENSS